MNLRLAGNTETSSSSTMPVTATLLKVRYAATVPSKAPLLHSAMNSARFVALGATSSAMDERASHVFFWLHCSGKSEGLTRWLAASNNAGIGVTGARAAAAASV